MSKEVFKNTMPIFNQLNPIIYDNDSHEDVYTDEYLITLASIGEITLKGIITTTSFTDPWQKPQIQFEWLASGRDELIAKARRSGMTSFPDAVRGPSVSLVRPVSGRIEDTIPIGSSGAELIVSEAKKATPEKPLLIIMGGQSTCVADAYLMDHSIAENILVLWLAGEGSNDLYGYNASVDTWGTYIIISKFKTILFGAVFLQAPYVPKFRLSELPYTELRQFMIEKELPHVNLPLEHDYDSQPAIPVMRLDYIKEYAVKSFSHFGSEGTSLLKDDNQGNIYVVTQANKEIATEEWWRAMTDIRAYKGNSIRPTNTPYNKTPFAVPGLIPAGKYDYGGEGIAYHCSSGKTGSLTLKTAFRPTDRLKFDYLEDVDEYILEPLELGEWITYSVDVRIAGSYTIKVIAASGMSGGAFHVEFDEDGRCFSSTVPKTNGWNEWYSAEVSKVFLNSGRHTMKIVCDSGRFTLKQFILGCS